VADSLVFLPFRIVYVPTICVGRAVAWFAAGYREATALERVLILPSWAVLRGTFIVGWGLAQVLHCAGCRALRQ
jgi:hypothetical protein